MRPGDNSQSLEVPEEPWTCVSVNFIVSLSLTASGHTAILVPVDRFSKIANFVPTTDNISAQNTAVLFMHKVIRFAWWLS